VAAAAAKVKEVGSAAQAVARAAAARAAAATV